MADVNGFAGAGVALVWNEWPARSEKGKGLEYVDGSHVLFSLLILFLFNLFVLFRKKH